MSRIKSSSLPANDSERALEYLADLARTVHRLACDIRALDQRATEDADAGSGVPVCHRLERLLADAREVEADCGKARDASLAAQMAKLGARGRRRPLKLNIGSGRFLLKEKGWLDLDVPPADLAMNLQWRLPFPDASASRVFMSHVLEHFYYPAEALALCKELRRVLRTGGRVRIIVPDIEKWLRAYVEHDARFFENAAQVWRFLSRGTRLEQVLLYAGSAAGSDPAFFFGHKTGYDFETLRKLLRRCGFRKIERSAFMQSRDPSLRVDDHSAVADAAFYGGHYSLFVEAVR